MHHKSYVSLYSLLDTVLSCNQSQIRVRGHHLMFKDPMQLNSSFSRKDQSPF